MLPSTLRSRIRRRPRRTRSWSLRFATAGSVITSICACGGKPASPPSNLTYDVGSKRETAALATYKVTLPSNGMTFDVESLSEPKVSADKDGGARIELTFAKDEPELQCLVASRFLTAGALLRDVAGSLLSTSKQKGYEVQVRGTPNSPSVSMNMLLEVPEDGRAVMVEWKMLLAYRGNGTVLCQTATVGYNATLKRMFEKVALGSFANVTDTHVYGDLSVAKKGDFVVGFQWTRAYVDPAETRTVDYTSIFGMGQEGFLGVDQVIVETTGPKGDVLSHVHASDSRDAAQTLVVKAQGKGGMFNLESDGDETTGKLEALPTSFLQNANTLKRLAKGTPKPGVIRVTDIGGGGGKIVTIKDVPATRESGRSIVLAEADGHARCEVDEDGRCAKYSKGSITFERVMRVGQLPKVP